MKPSADHLKSLCPDVDERLISDHLDRLGEAYFDRFTPTEVADHINALADLSADQPCRVLMDTTDEQHIRCTVLSSDFPSVFSLITGVLSGAGFGITSGDIFTYAHGATAPAPAAKPRRRVRSRRKIKPTDYRRIIDHFEGSIAADQTAAQTAELMVERLCEVLGMAARGDVEALQAARLRVNQMVTERLSAIDRSAYRVLYPVQIDIGETTDIGTWIRVVSQDTPSFLYALSTALSLHGLSIEGVRIRTEGGRIEDDICVADTRGRAVTDRKTLDQIKLSVLLTKQFTYFLDQAPDPNTALMRFEHLSRQVLSQPHSEQWIDQLSDPRTMQDLARVLGASDFLWEDFIRFQADALLPVLKPLLEGERFAQTREEMETELDRALAAAPGPGDHRKALNKFKDDQIFLIDLEYILSEATTFRTMSERLTTLAELVVDRAAQTAYEALVDRHGRPRAADGSEVTYAALGLGKLGGKALGYASDIELMFVYSDAGETDGRDTITNAAFHERMVQEVCHIIEAKREGIFHIDLRLRPYGREGPLTCTLETFSAYYQPGGPAHSLERLALVRLRPIAGDTDFGERIRVLRDQLLYTGQSIDHKELREARQQQYEEHRGGRPNAKFGCGALVDLEQAVQLVQVEFGGQIPALRTPRIHEAIARLGESGALSEADCRDLDDSYTFLRQLINGLRMLRGSARDLVLPEPDSDDFVFLARRLGYTRQRGLEPADRLRFRFDWYTALVRGFIDRRFGRAMLPDPAMGNPADLVLSAQVDAPLRDNVLENMGVSDAESALMHLRAMSGGDETARALARLLNLAQDRLRERTDTDRTLARWARYVEQIPDRAAHFRRLRNDPVLLTHLLRVFDESAFVTHALVKCPELLSWVHAAGMLDEAEDSAALEEKLRTFAAVLNESDHG